jgi:hypothetical protein
MFLIFIGIYYIYDKIELSKCKSQFQKTGSYPIELVELKKKLNEIPFINIFIDDEWNNLK